jgi:oxaloacetate decarboxylase gamma subunit
MTIEQMFGQSGVLTLLGMVVVFGFLIILVACITLLGKFVHAMGWDKEPVKAVPSAAPIRPAPVAAAGSQDNAVLAAVITGAVTQYRETHR